MYFTLCRYIFELILSSCFDSHMGAISGPEMLLFERFRDVRTKLKKDAFITRINEMPNDLHSTTHEFLEYNLSTQIQYRNDYRESL